jgi:hypothetical protein
MFCDAFDIGNSKNVEGAGSLLLLLPANQRNSAIQCDSPETVHIYIRSQWAEWFIGGLITPRKYSRDIIRSQASSHLHPCSLWNTLKMEKVISSRRCHLYTNVHGIKPQKPGIIFYNFNKLREYSAVRGIGKRKLSALKFLRFNRSYMELAFSSSNRWFHLPAVTLQSPH